MAQKCPKCNTINSQDSQYCKKCATALPLNEGQASFTKTLETTSDELARGTVFAGRYEIIEELGAGGMGRVYRAHDAKLNEEIALKLIKPEIAADKRTVERFHNEIKNARKISHPNVCRTHDLGEEGRTLYLTMEYIRGEDLKSLIHRMKALTVGAAVSVGRQIAAGLAEAHKQGIVHRDLKPGNVMIDKDGQAKIMDFGIARSLQGGGITGEGAIIGTPEYMSPEQVEGKPADARADIYALGIILFEMVTGQVPFEGETPFAIAVKHKNEMPPVPKKLAPQIPEGLSRLILKCLEKDKAKRYQTADDLVVDLAAVEQALPTAERVAAKRKTITHREVTVKFQPRKLVFPAAIVFILAVAGFFLWRSMVHRPAPPLLSAKPTLAIFNFENIAKDPGLEGWTQGLRIMLTDQLNQCRYLRTVGDPTLTGILKKLGLSQDVKYTADELKRIAQEGGATHLLIGSLFPAGAKVILSLSLIEAKSGGVFKSIQDEAPDRQAIHTSIDSLARKIKSALDITEAAIDERIYKLAGDVYSRNPKALQEYFLGVQFRESGDIGKAVQALDNAVAIDPEFAMAYRGLSSLYANSGDFLKKFENLRKAYSLKDKLPERDRLIVEASWLQLTEAGIPKAHAVWQKLTELYPEDPYGSYGFAWTADSTEEAIKSYDYLLHVLNQKGDAAFNMLTRSYCWREDYRKARECYEETLQAFPTQTFRHAMLGNLFALEHNLEAARSEYQKAGAGATEFWLKAQIANYYFAKEEMQKTWEIIENVRKEEKDPSIADAWLVSLNLAGGRFKEGLDIETQLAEKALRQGGGNIDLSQGLAVAGKMFLQAGYPEKALEKFTASFDYAKREEDRVQVTGLTSLMHSMRPPMTWQICALCDLGRIEEAEALYAQFELLIPGWVRKVQKPCFCGLDAFPAGKIALARKDAPAAIRKLEEGLRRMRGEDFFETSDHAYLFDMLAEAYLLGGRLDAAAQAYARIPQLFSGSADWPAVYSRSYYKLGKVLEQMGKKAEAREKYNNFLKLWKDADAGLPEVDDAKKRLAAL